MSLRGLRVLERKDGSETMKEVGREEENPRHTAWER